MKKSLIFPVSNVSLHISLLFVLSLKAKIFVLSGRFLGHLSYIYLSLQAWLWARARNTNLKPASQTGILGGFWVLIEKCSMMNILQHYIDRISFSLLGLWTGARSQSFASDIWAASSPGADGTVGRWGGLRWRSLLSQLLSPPPPPPPLPPLTYTCQSVLINICTHIIWT